ncbi:NADH-quinone oxidoreductase subunit C [Desulfococcus sp.]|uniref:hydrogenase large subunit n=1 Tax=Desulfococcus sp. TaxID=2025834 RepID=UPI00359429A1
MADSFVEVLNGTAVHRPGIPHLGFTDFRRQALDIVASGGKVVQLFAYTDGDTDKLMAVLRTDKLMVAGCDAPESYPSLSAQCEQFHLFEREIAEQFGIRPEGHPWLKLVRYHPNYRGKEDVFGNDYQKDIPGNYDYYSVEGEEIHEVAVGPVHAGVIEPGHFRFNCIGEKVLHLEIQLGYQHRGIESLLLKVDPKRLPVIADSIAGDTAVGHGVSMAQAIEALSVNGSSILPDEGAIIIRTIGLELERLANHIGDLGALSGDVAFLPPANYFGRIRGDFLNLTLLICGNRFGKGLVRPGGVRFAIYGELRRLLMDRINELEPQVRHVLDLLLMTPSVLARFEGCGIVRTDDAEKLGLVGPAGRASGLAYDARRCFPMEYYVHLHIPENPKFTGDVYARAWVRADEILQSINIVKSLLDHPIETRQVNPGKFELTPSSFVVTVNEAWRGEISHCIITNAEGGMLRYKIKDPSFHNWNGLAMALRNTGISDFPLNNKSFNLSYCGVDL